MAPVDRIDGCRNIRAISLKFLLFCCFDFDPKISTKYIYSVYHLFYFYLNCRMVQDIGFYFYIILLDYFSLLALPVPEKESQPKCNLLSLL